MVPPDKKANPVTQEQLDIARYRRGEVVIEERLDSPVDIDDVDDELSALFDSEYYRRKTALDRAEAAYKARIQRCRADPNAYIEYVFEDSTTGAPLVQADFHRELQNAFQHPAYQYGIYILPRDHGKTTQVEGFTLWALGNNPNLRIKIICASDGKAKERLFTIMQTMEHNSRHKEVFPDLKPAQIGDWTKHKIVVQRDRIMRDASVEALGVTSTATGGRADLLIADDVVDRRNALEQPKLRETIKTAWDSDWINLLEPDGRVIYICTLWHTADLTHKIVQNPQYKILRYDIPEDFTPLWPAKWPREALIKRRDVIGHREFDRGFRNLALTGDIVVIKPEWIKYWDSPPDLGSLVIFQAHDPSEGTGSDWHGSVTIGVDLSQLKTFVLDAHHGMYTLLLSASHIEKLARDWLPLKIGIESIGFQVCSYLAETTLLDVIPLRPRLSKWLRLSALTPYFERGQILFNPSLEPTVLSNAIESGDLVTELLQFPLGSHDDLVDAFVHAFNLARDYILESGGDSVRGGSARVVDLSVDGEDDDDSDALTRLTNGLERQRAIDAKRTKYTALDGSSLWYEREDTRQGPELEKLERPPPHEPEKKTDTKKRRRRRYRRVPKFLRKG